MVPNPTKTTIDELKDFRDTFYSPENIAKRNKAAISIKEIFNDQSKMWQYCIDNKCTIDDLIEAHKKTNQK